MARTHTTPVKHTVQMEYTAVPTASYFHHDPSFVRAILGPVGSGKSVACCFDMFMKALDEPPGPDGFRKTRWLATRSTFPELKTTTVQTFLDWFGGIGTITYDSPIRYLSTLPLPDGTALHWEVWFKPLDGSQESLDSLRSLEITGAWINEGHECPRSAMDVLRTRVGRYRPYPALNPKYKGIIIDSNYGNTSSPLKSFLDEQPPGWAFFEQPPAVLWDAAAEKWVTNPYAENLAHLPDGILYYERALAGMQEHNIKQLLACQWGNPRSGKPIFPEFNTRLHVFRGRIKADRKLPLWIGMDFGIHVAAALGQLTPQGSLVILDELWDDDASLDDFVKRRLLTHLSHHYRGFNVKICGDPAGMGRSPLDKRTAFDVLRANGLSAFPSPNNDPIIRRDALRAFMLRTSGLLIDPSCKRLTEGLAGAFGYKRRPDGTFSDQAVKNVFSHTCEAAEYLAVFARMPVHNRAILKPEAAVKASEAFYYG